MLPRTVSMRAAYGRAASAAAWARRNFDAATICMALVIFCVALVAAMRLRRSLSEGIDLDDGRQTTDDRTSIRHIVASIGPPLSVVGRPITRTSWRNCRRPS